MKTPSLISLHGGHSGQFCCHAKDSLEDMIQAYIDKGFPCVGISEHMPPASDKFLFPDEVEQGKTARDLQISFGNYFEELERLKIKYRDRIHIYKGFETEFVTDSLDQALSLIDEFSPDYIVGSIHHLNDQCFDYSRGNYEAIAGDCGSVDAMYLEYFDAQFEMIQTLRPFVVGHFDIIRIFDHDFEARLEIPEIREKIERNLGLIKDLGLVLDYNLRPLSRGDASPYLAPMILHRALELGIQAVPGDDAHSKEQAGAFVDQAVLTLDELGFSTQWPKPRILTPPG